MNHSTKNEKVQYNKTLQKTRGKKSVTEGGNKRRVTVAKQFSDLVWGVSLVFLLHLLKKVKPSANVLLHVGQTSVE